MEGAQLQLKLKNYLYNKKKEQKSLFHHEYINYYNYSKITKKLYFNSEAKLNKTLYFDFNSNSYGDLISNIIFQINLPDISSLRTTTGSKVGYTNGVGNALIKKITFKIGGNVIEEHNGEFMDIYSSLFIPNDKKNLYNAMIKKFDILSTSNFQGGLVQVPLFFWFCQSNNENKSMILPLLSLRKTEVEMYIELRSLNELLIYDDDSKLTNTDLNNFTVASGNLLVDFILLENEERMKYLNAKSQYYLITQSQYLNYDILQNSSVGNFSLREFKYPIIEIFWIIRKKENINKNNYFNYTNSLDSNVIKNGFINTVRILFNTIDRYEEIDAEYFYITEPFKYHNVSDPYKHINVLSFSNSPMDLSQPEGTCNFSNIYDTKLILNLINNMPASEIFIYAINYNILQIDESGRAYLLHTLSKSTPEEIKDVNCIDN